MPPIGKQPNYLVLGVKPGSASMAVLMSQHPNIDRVRQRMDFSRAANLLPPLPDKRLDDLVASHIVEARSIPRAQILNEATSGHTKLPTFADQRQTVYKLAFPRIKHPARLHFTPAKLLKRSDSAGALRGLGSSFCRVSGHVFSQILGCAIANDLGHLREGGRHAVAMQFE